MRISTILATFLHKSITLESLDGMYRELHPPLDNPFALILSFRSISANDRQSAEFRSNFELILLPPLKMKIATVDYRFYKSDAGYIQNDNQFAQPRRLYQS